MPNVPPELPTFEEVARAQEESAQRVADALAKALGGANDASEHGLPELRIRDPAMRAEIELHVAAICDLADRGAGAAWEIGAHYNALIPRRHARARSVAIIRGYLSSRLGGRLTFTTLLVYANVQASFTKEAVDTFGPARLNQLLRFFRAQGGEKPPPDKAGLEALRIPVPYCRELVMKLFSDCTERELERNCIRQKRDQLPQGDVRLVERTAEAITSGTSGRVQCEVIVVNGRAAMKLGRVLVWDLVPVAEAILAAAKPPRPAHKSAKKAGTKAPRSKASPALQLLQKLDPVLVPLKPRR